MWAGSVSGRSWERFGSSKVEKHRDGQLHSEQTCQWPSQDSSDFNRDRGGPATGSHLGDSKALAHINGLLGANEMIKFGMIIDCTRQMLYVNPNGRSPVVSQSLTSFLADRGFTRIPIRLNANHHFDVQGALNGHATRFIVDTGSANTLIDKQVAVRSGTGMTAMAGVGAGGAGGLAEGINRTGVKELTIGNFKLADAEVAIAGTCRATYCSRNLRPNRMRAFWARNISHRISLSSTWAAWRFIYATPIPANSIWLGGQSSARRIVSACTE